MILRLVGLLMRGYHALLIEWDGKHDGTHYKPGTPVPEPWNSLYFGG